MEENIPEFPWWKSFTQALPVDGSPPVSAFWENPEAAEEIDYVFLRRQ
jgi:hypothetical protein